MFSEQSVVWLTCSPSHLSTNCLVLPGRISQYQGGLDIVPVCKRDILRDSAGLSSRDRQADGEEHCMITVWEPWLPADALFPPVSATALCVIHLWQLSFFPLLQSNFPKLSGRGRKEEEAEKKRQWLRSVCMSSGHLPCKSEAAPPFTWVISISHTNMNVCTQCHADKFHWLKNLLIKNTTSVDWRM